MQRDLLHVSASCKYKRRHLLHDVEHNVADMPSDHRTPYDRDDVDTLWCLENDTEF